MYGHYLVYGPVRESYQRVTRCCRRVMLVPLGIDCAHQYFCFIGNLTTIGSDPGVLLTAVYSLVSLCCCAVNDVDMLVLLVDVLMC